MSHDLRMASLDAPPIIVATTDRVIPLTQSDGDTDILVVGRRVFWGCGVVWWVDLVLFKLADAVLDSERDVALMDMVKF